MQRQTFRKHQRLSGRVAFAVVYARRCTASDAHMVVFVHRNSVGCPRLGLSVGRKHGRAVDRSRRKRLLREAFRLSQHELPQNFDVIIVPRVRSRVSLKSFKNSLVQLTKQAADRWGKHEDFDLSRERIPY